jgi:pheromone shutdown protein TraB
VVAPAGKADGVATEVKEMKKMNKHLKKLVDLKKQDNLMSAVFYLCAIAVGVVYLLIISH